MCGICGFVGAQRGMFAFVIWDEGKKELFAARDFFGIKPLHYAMIGGNFVFASEIKSILRFPGCGKRLNEEALEQYLSFQYSVLEETFFKGIYRLQPGSFLRWRVGEDAPEIRSYFEPSLAAPWEKSEEEWTEAVDRAIKDSAEAHSIADVEIGVFLSGGYRIDCKPEALRLYQRLPLKLRKILARLAGHLPNWKGKHFLIRGSKTVEERFIGNANIFSFKERRELLRVPTAAPDPGNLLGMDHGRSRGDAGRGQDAGY